MPDIVWFASLSQLIATFKVSPSADTPVYGCSVNPVNPSKCSVFGNRIFRFLSIEEERCVTGSNSQGAFRCPSRAVSV
jgi:hypothetical protein